MKNNSVFMTVLSTSERDGWLAPGLLGFVMGLGKSGGPRREISVELMYNVHPVDAARNTIAKNFLASDCEWLCMIDNDMTPPPNLLELLDRAAEHMDVLVPKFHVTLNVVQRETIRTDVGVGWQRLNANADAGEWNELSLASSGLMFVRRNAFERMTKPFFRFVYDEDGRVCECEDLFFCRKAREAGLSIWGNSNYYVEHFKTIPLSLPARSSQLDLRGVAGRVPAIASSRGMG
ncbi:MAG: hypothetical protein JWO71_3122 [Candidatus Acidoferrum typicum]|nr:hypothetical protein [Candidatus Acidoferrum typicum]